MEEKKKNILIGVLVGIIVILLGIGIYFVFIKKDNNSIQNNEPEVDEYNLINKEFKTKDNKFILKIVSKNDKKAFESAKDVYYEISDGKRSYNNDGVLYYGYLNNDVIEIKKIKKVDYYLIVDTELPSASNILINMNTNTIDEDESRLLLKDYDRFFGDTGTNWYDVIKVNNGYFITSHNPALEDSSYIVFTTNWKKIGYTSYNPTIDKDGIYVYDNDKLTGSLVKYDVNGNKIS